MLDLETMGNCSNSVICSIGAVQFDIKSGKTGWEFYVNIDIDSCLDIGLIVNGGTIKWWLLQNETARNDLAKNKCIDIKQALTMFNEYMNSINGHDINIWGNGVRFDVGILEDAYNKSGINIPWNFRLERDVRTLVSFIPEIKKTTQFVGIEHNPIDDCKHQIKYCSKIYNIINKNM